MADRETVDWKKISATLREGLGPEKLEELKAARRDAASLRIPLQGASEIHEGMQELDKDMLTNLKGILSKGDAGSLLDLSTIRSVDHDELPKDHALRIYSGDVGRIYEVSLTPEASLPGLIENGARGKVQLLLKPRADDFLIMACVSGAKEPDKVVAAIGNNCKDVDGAKFCFLNRARKRAWDYELEELDPDAAEARRQEDKEADEAADQMAKIAKWSNVYSGIYGDNLGSAIGRVLEDSSNSIVSKDLASILGVRNNLRSWAQSIWTTEADKWAFQPNMLGQNIPENSDSGELLRKIFRRHPYIWELAT